MAYEGFGAGITSALGSFQTASDNRFRKNLAREQMQIEREAADQKLFENETKNKLTRYTNAVGIYSQNGNADIWLEENADWLGGAEKNENAMNAAIDALSIHSEDYNTFINEEGQEVGAKLVGFRKIKATDETGKETERFVPRIKREDTGEIVPMTENRGSDAGEAFVSLSREQLNTKMAGAFQDAVARGALIDNQGQRLAGFRNLKQVKNNIEKSYIKEMAAKQYAADQRANNTYSPADMTRFYDSLGDITSIEELRALAIKMGIDVNAVQAQADKEAEIAWKEEHGGNLPGSLGELLAEDGVTEKEWNALSKEQRLKAIERIQKRQTGPVAMVFQALSETGAEVKDVLTDSYRAATEWWDEQVSEVDVLNRVFGKVTDPIPKEGPRDEAQAEAMRKRRLREMPVTEEAIKGALSWDSLGTGASKIELTAADMRKIIKEGIAKPTDNQKGAVMQFLNKNNVNNDAELVQAVKEKRVSKADALSAALALAITEKGSLQDQTKAMQGFINLLERNDANMGVSDQILSNYRNGSLALAQDQEKRLRRRLRSDLSKDERDYISGQNDKAKEVQENTIDPFVNEALATIDLVERNKDGTYRTTDDEPDFDDDSLLKLGRLISRYRPKIMSTTNELEIQRHQLALNQVLNLYVQNAAAVDEGRLGQGFADLWREEPDGTIDFKLGNIRIAKKEGDTITDIAWVDEGGVNSQTVALSDIKKDHPVVARLLVGIAQQNEKMGQGQVDEFDQVPLRNSGTE